jgi:hypothetical protein
MEIRINNVPNEASFDDIQNAICRFFYIPNSIILFNKYKYGDIYDVHVTLSDEKLGIICLFLWI